MIVVEGRVAHAQELDDKRVQPLNGLIGDDRCGGDRARVLLKVVMLLLVVVMTLVVMPRALLSVRLWMLVLRRLVATVSTVVGGRREHLRTVVARFVHGVAVVGGIVPR